MHQRRELTAPTGRAGERCFPQQLPGGCIKAAHQRAFDPRLRDQQFAIHVQRRRERQIHVGPMPSPEQPSGVLFHGNDLSFGRVRVQPTAAANREMLHGPFQPSSPTHPQRRFQSLRVGVRAAEVSVVRVPIELRIRERPGEWTANFPNFQILLWQRSFSVGTKHVEVAVLAPDIDLPTGHRHRSRDRRAKRRREGKCFAAGQRHDIQLPIQSAVDRVVTSQHRRTNRSRRAEHFRLFFARFVTAQTESLFGLHSIHIAAANAHRSEAQQAGQVNRGLSPLHEIGFDRVLVEFQNLDSARVVAPVPLYIDVARFISALTKRGGELGPIVGRNLTDHAKLRMIASIIEKHGPPTRRNDDRLADQTKIA